MAVYFAHGFRIHESGAKGSIYSGKESPAEIVNDINGWLGVENEEQSPNEITRNITGRAGLHPSGLLELQSNRTKHECPCSPQQIFPSNAVPYATCDQWGTRWNCGFSYPTATKVNGRWQCSGVCTVRCRCSTNFDITNRDWCTRSPFDLQFSAE